MIWARVAPPDRLSRAKTVAVLLPSRAPTAGFGVFAPLAALGAFLQVQRRAYVAQRWPSWAFRGFGWVKS